MSKVEVNTIEPQCGTTLTVGKCTTSVAVPGNVVKSNALQASDGGNIVSQSGTDITLGASGDTVTLASGASQSGFGREGSVDWNTTKITADPANAVSGTGYFCDTSGGAFTVTLPTSPSAGDIVAVADYTRTFQTNNLTIGRNSKSIGGVAQDAKLDVEGQSATFVFVDDTEGWINVQETQTSQTGVLPFIIATGGTPCAGATVGDYKVHTFTGPGTLCVSSAGSPGGSTTVDYLVVAGGGAGGASYNPSWGGAAGGGGGGYRESVPSPAAWTASPIANPGNARPVSVQGYPITVGAGGVVSPQSSGCRGSDSIFSDITSTGGGGGRGSVPPSTLCNSKTPGGSGGGSSPACTGPGLIGQGNTPPVSPAQGTPGGQTGGPSPAYGMGGGGGATVAGAVGRPSGPAAGGTGGTTCITGSPISKSGGGGGSAAAGPTGPASPCGTGAPGVTGPQVAGIAAAANTGGGGSGAAGGPPTAPIAGGAGGSGIVVIRYKFQ